MAEVKLILQTDPSTGKKNLIIEHVSESDMLPHEHEEEHRELVNALLEQGIVSAEDLGHVVVRVGGQTVALDPELEEGERESASVEENPLKRKLMRS